MSEPQLKSAKRAALELAEANITRFRAELAQIAKERSEEPDLEFQPRVTLAYDAAMAAKREELELAERIKATCLADVEAEDARRDRDAARRQARRANLLAVGAFLTTAGTLIYELLKK